MLPRHAIKEIPVPIQIYLYKRGMIMFSESMETEALILKRISPDDRGFIFRQFSDDAVNRYLFDAEPMQEIREADELIDFYTAPQPRRQQRWILILKDGGEKIGTCGFHCWDWDARRAEVGYDLQSAFWGRGLMTQAMQAVLSVMANRLEIQTADACIYTENLPSIRLAQRLGFTFSGELKTCIFRGKPYWHKIYTLDCGKYKVI